MAEFGGGSFEYGERKCIGDGGGPFDHRFIGRRFSRCSYVQLWDEEQGCALLEMAGHSRMSAQFRENTYRFNFGDQGGFVVTVVA